MADHGKLPPLAESVAIGLLNNAEQPSDQELLANITQHTHAALIRALLIKADTLHQEGIDTRKAFLIGFALRGHVQQLTDSIMPLDIDALLQPPAKRPPT